VEKALEAVLAGSDVLTPDLGGKASTREVGEAVAQGLALVAESE